MKNDFASYFIQYLNQIQHEINSYQDEEDIWKTVGDSKNSAGNLCLHIVGNLNHFIGKALAGTAYIRNRDAEFEQKHISKNQLTEDIEHVKVLIDKTLPHINNLTDLYPDGFGHENGSIHYELLRLLAHLAYHTGQINYHRRAFADIV